MAVDIHVLSGAEHEPFAWEGSNGGAAVFVHGFPSSPAEMRTVAGWLHAAGWSALGPRLPGFGSELLELDRFTERDWLASVLSSLHEARARYAPLLLVANSMGCALSLQAAAQLPVDGLILFSPFWRVEIALLDLLYPVVQRVFPRVRALRLVDFDHAPTRAVLLQYFPDADLDDPEVRATLRDLALSVSVLGQVRQAGRLGFAAAPHVRAPVLVLQGSRDPLVTPAQTRKLMAQLPNLAGYVELPADHELVHMKDPKLLVLEPLVRRFAANIRGNPEPQA